MAVDPTLNSRRMVMITYNWKRHAFAAVIAGTAIAAACSGCAAPVRPSTGAVKQARPRVVQDVRWGWGGGWRGGWGGWRGGWRGGAFAGGLLAGGLIGAAIASPYYYGYPSYGYGYGYGYG